MSKKRAFVRYTKSGEIVPGSLIITTNGGYPDKSSLWKEVTVDQCCPSNGGDCTPQLSGLTLTETTVIPTSPGFFTSVTILLSSEECDLDQVFTIPIASTSLSYTQLIDLLNTNFSFLGLFSYTAPDIISLQLSSEAFLSSYVNNCPNTESWFFNIQIPFALPNPNN